MKWEVMTICLSVCPHKNWEVFLKYFFKEKWKQQGYIKFIKSDSKDIFISIKCCSLHFVFINESWRKKNQFSQKY